MKRSVAWLCLVALMLALSGCGGLRAEDLSLRTQLNTPQFSVSADWEKQQLPPEMDEFAIEEDSPWLSHTKNRKLTATDYFVYDLNYNRFVVLSGQTADKVYPASTTKLFTAYVALQHIQPTEKITITTELELVDPASSVAGLQAGDTVTVRQLVAAMMLPSGNDATYVLTATVGRRLSGNASISDGEAVALFVQQMNDQAKQLGMENSNFVTPDGFHDPAHLISIGDLVTISKLAMEQPLIRELVSQTTLTEDVGSRQLTLKSTNLLLYPQAGYYCEYAVGLKTGYTSPAGNCLLSVFQQGNRQLLIGVFGCPNDVDRFAETLVLFAQAAGLDTPGTKIAYGTIAR